MQRGSLGSRFSSNPFHFSTGDARNFDGKKGPGERFDGLRRQWDFITTLAYQAALRFKLGKGRKLELGLGGALRGFTQNQTASYARLSGGAELDLSRHDKGSLGLSFVPSRFKKNLSVASTGRFEAARYQQIGVDLGYERRLSKKWTAGIGYEFRTRAFNPKFEDRDRDGHSVLARAKYRAARKVTLHSKLAYGTFDSNIGDRAGVRIDRSFEQLRFSPGVRVGLGKWRLGLRLDYRRREFSTSEVQDRSRHNRVDDLFGVRLDARRKLPVKGLELKGFLGWQRNDASPDDPTIPSDDTGYDEFVAGIGLKFTF